MIPRYHDSRALAAMPTFQIVLELSISGIVAAGSLTLLAMTPKLIRREKMLP